MSRKLIAGAAALLFALAGLTGAVAGRIGAGSEVKIIPADDVKQLAADVADIRERIARMEGFLQVRIEGRK